MGAPNSASSILYPSLFLLYRFTNLKSIVYNRINNMKNTKMLLEIIAVFTMTGLAITGCIDGETTDPCANGHVFEWKVTNAQYPAFSTEICINCNKHSGAAERVAITGDTGPAGGIIFYIAADGFSLTGTEFTAHYLEAAPSNATTSNISWASSSYFFYDVEGTETAIGTGKNNTQKIVDTYTDDITENYAAKACVQYSNGGKNDWFLPSKDELNALYESNVIDTGSFWSSSQYNSHSAWSQFFHSGDQSTYDKNTICMVRAIRAF